MDIILKKSVFILLICNCDALTNRITVPEHSTIGKGLLRKLIRDSGISMEEFVELLYG